MADDEEPPNHRATMMGVLAVVILLALSWWVTHALYVSGKTEDCLMSGRSNCAEVR